MSYPHSDLSDHELVERLRRQSWIWFKNDDILLLEELIRRFEAAEASLAKALRHADSAEHP